MDYRASLQVACGVKVGLYAIGHDVCEALEEYGCDGIIIFVSANPENTFKRTSREDILAFAVTHTPSIARLVNALYSEGTPYMQFGDIFLHSTE